MRNSILAMLSMLAISSCDSTPPEVPRPDGAAVTTFAASQTTKSQIDVAQWQIFFSMATPAGDPARYLAFGVDGDGVGRAAMQLLFASDNTIDVTVMVDGSFGDRFVVDTTTGVVQAFAKDFGPARRYWSLLLADVQASQTQSPATGTASVPYGCIWGPALCCGCNDEAIKSTIACVNAATAVAGALGTTAASAVACGGTAGIACVPGAVGALKSDGDMFAAEQGCFAASLDSSTCDQLVNHGGALCAISAGLVQDPKTGILCNDGHTVPPLACKCVDGSVLAPNPATNRLMCMQLCLGCKCNVAEGTPPLPISCVTTDCAIYECNGNTNGQCDPGAQAGAVMNTRTNTCCPPYVKATFTVPYCVDPATNVVVSTDTYYKY